MKWIDTFSLILIVAAGLHLGLVGLFEIDLIARVFGSQYLAVYDLMGLSAVWQLSSLRFF
jgi:uncharacterized membrane protein YuzA (DUF378 family)